MDLIPDFSELVTNILNSNDSSVLFRMYVCSIEMFIVYNLRTKLYTTTSQNYE